MEERGRRERAEERGRRKREEERGRRERGEERGRRERGEERGRREREREEEEEEEEVKVERAKEREKSLLQYSTQPVKQLGRKHTFLLSSNTVFMFSIQIASTGPSKISHFRSGV